MALLAQERGPLSRQVGISAVEGSTTTRGGGRGEGGSFTGRLVLLLLCAHEGQFGFGCFMMVLFPMVLAGG